MIMHITSESNHPINQDILLIRPVFPHPFQFLLVKIVLLNWPLIRHLLESPKTPFGKSKRLPNWQGFAENHCDTEYYYITHIYKNANVKIAATDPACFVTPSDMMKRNLIFSKYCSQTFVVIIDKCPTFSVTQATLSTQDVYPDAKVTITCDPNLRIDGRVESVLNVTCGAGGVWQPAVPTQCIGMYKIS